MDSFKDKTVVITGGATGIGFGLAKRFGSEGAKIVIGEPRQHRLDEAVDALQALGIEASALVMDVTDPASVEALADFAWTTYGGAHVLINNAGVPSKRKPIVEVPMEEVRQLFDVNFFDVNKLFDVTNFFDVRNCFDVKHVC